MNTKTRQFVWLAAAGLTLSLAVPATANAHFQTDPGTNIVLGAAATYALIQAIDDNDGHRHRDHRRDHRHDGRPFSSHYRHDHGRHHGHAYGHRHAYRHAYRHGYRHGHARVLGYPGRTCPPYWYARR